MLGEKLVVNGELSLDGLYIVSRFCEIECNSSLLQISHVPTCELAMELILTLFQNE